jgi:Uri superfamily endonuclease
MNHLPGTYALVLRSSQPCQLQIGRLGGMQVRPGFYIYVGSAIGPGGLSGRLSHHLRPPASPHWHIDYLRQAAEVVEVWAVEGREKREHAWAQSLCACPECSIPRPRFGASDCRCPAHLVYREDRPSLGWFGEVTGYSAFPIAGQVHYPRG